MYPATHYAVDIPSELGNMAAAPLSTKALQWFYERYPNSPAGGAHPLFSVLRANLQGLPQATVITAATDPLRFEGAAYAQKLITAVSRLTIATTQRSHTSLIVRVPPVVPQCY